MNCCGNSQEQKSVTNPLPTEQLENKPSAGKNIFVWGLVIVLIISLVAWLL